MTIATSCNHTYTFSVVMVNNIFNRKTGVLHRSDRVMWVATSEALPEKSWPMGSLCGRMKPRVVMLRIVQTKSSCAYCSNLPQES